MPLVRGVGGTVLPGLRDHHVHLGLVDVDAVGDAVLSAVDDLGWELDQALDWRHCGPGGLRVRVAGPFLTAPGGYPYGRSWAPEAAVVALDSADAAGAVVAGLIDAGVDMIKVVLHTGMPLLGDRQLGAAVDTAHRLGRPVVAHTEGEGQAERALAAGVDVLAHTPWTERLTDDLVAALARGTTMISSLAIHAGDQEVYTVAVDNLTRFHAAGGRIRYGTDLGNGSKPPGLDPAELTGLVDAGLDVAAIVGAIATAEPAPGWVTWSPFQRPRSVAEAVDWFATVRRCRLDDLEGS
jgi:hypothetical protein